MQPRSGLYLALLAASALAPLHVQGLSVGRAALAGSLTTLRKIDVFVMNLEHRTDRWECMQKRMTGVPANVNVTRHVAATGLAGCGSKVSTDALNIPDSNVQNVDHVYGSFCSNYQIWEQATRSDADYVVILEDDTLLSPDFWDKLTKLTSECSFDYIAVDMFRNLLEQPECGAFALVEQGCGSDRLFKAPTGTLLYQGKYLGAGYCYHGIHTSIFRKSFAATLVQRAQQGGAGTMDGWWWENLKHDAAFAWFPRGARQSSKGCSLSVKASDNEPGKYNTNPWLSRIFGGRAAK